MLDLDKLDAEFTRIVQSADGITSVAAHLAKAYDDYAKGAVIAGASCAAGGDRSVLESAFTSDNTSATILNMASQLCGYWQSLPTPGIAAHGGVAVATVVPSFQTLNSALYVAISGCITTSLVEKPYMRLFGAIEAALKTAPIFIVETMANGSTASFTEYLQ